MNEHKNGNENHMTCITCINCPLGCEIEVKSGVNEGMEFINAKCVVGEGYAKKELTQPERTVTTTVATINSKTPLLPVRTSTAIPKSEVFNLIKMSREIKVNVPIKRGDVIVKNLFATNVDLISSKTLSD